MNLRNLRSGLYLLCLLTLCLPSAQAQQYRNLVNLHFNTVASGPMQAVVVDVPDASDTNAVRKAAITGVLAARQARAGALQREIALLRRYQKWKGNLSLAVPDIVIVRQNGQLRMSPEGTHGALPSITRGGNDITFKVDSNWPADQLADLQTIVGLVYQELKTDYGAPSWSGTVTILDGDRQNPAIGDRDALSGGIYNISADEIILPEHGSPIDRVLDLTQMMAIAFHGPASISYDVWERGMARAVSLVVANHLLSVLNNTTSASGGTLGDNFATALSQRQALDRYDLLNQPPLGNDRFFPVSLANQSVDVNTLAGMLIPRLQMASSAWLKVYAEDGNFFSNFNTAYYTALVGNPMLSNSVPGLIQIAQQVLPTEPPGPGVSTGGQVEGLPFNQWYDRQYIMDTSVSPGVKLYAYATPILPDASADDPAIAVFLIYYNTTFDTNGNSNEVNLSGICYPIYFDNTFQNRLFLGTQYEQVSITNGFGSVAPTFPNTLGGTDSQGRLRVTMDFPVGNQDVRLYTAPRSQGTIQSPNNFWGAVVNADTGTMQIQTLNVNTTLTVQQGVFGGALDPSAFAQPGQTPHPAVITFTNSAKQQTARRVNIGYSQYVSVFYAVDPVSSANFVLPQGPAMISFPLQPLHPKAADALLDPNTGLPLFTDNNLLLAQWDQSQPPSGSYLLYPSLDPLQPGKGYWENFSVQTPVMIIGRVATQDQNVSIGLIHGWNQIATPYQQAIDINNLQFQYLADNQAVGLQQAITNGWIVAQTVANVGQVSVWQYDTIQGYTAATQLSPWAGYWIRVLVAEGVTITYPNPTPGQPKVKSPAANAPSSSKAPTANSSATTPVNDGWAVSIAVHGPDGNGATAYLGQAASAKSGYDSQHDALRPPSFSRTVPSIAFSHSDWGTNAGDYFSDIRPTGSHDPWTITVSTPTPNKTYTLTWNRLATVPNTLHLRLVDLTTGKSQYLQNVSSYSFSPGTAATRTFQIVPELRTRNSLRIFNVVAQTTRASGSHTVQIAYSLTEDASVETQVLGLNGQILRHLNAGRAANSGANAITWDLRDDKGITLPTGAYILQIIATTSEGEKVRTVQPITIVR